MAAMDVSLDTSTDSYEYKLSKMTQLLEGSMLPVRFGPDVDGTTIQISNLPEVEGFIAQQADEELQRTLSAILKDIQSEIQLLNVPPPPSSYDAILYLNLHGKFQRDFYCDTDATYVDSGRKYLIHELDSVNKNVTLLTSTRIGVTHILNPEELSAQVKQLVNDQYAETHMLDLKKLQASLRGLKRELVDTFNPEPYISKGNYTRKQWVEFTHDVGWGISKNKWLNKTLQKDMKKFKWPIQVIRDEKRIIPIDLFDQLVVEQGETHMDLRGKPPHSITLDNIINRILSYGYTNILIIDSSCGNEPYYKGRYARRLARDQKKEDLFAGKTKKNKKRKKFTRARNKFRF